MKATAEIEGNTTPKEKEKKKKHTPQNSGSKNLFNQHEQRQPRRADRLQSRLPALCSDMTEDRNDNYDTTVSLQILQARVSDFKTNFSKSQGVVKSGSKAGVCSIYFQVSIL